MKKCFIVVLIIYLAYVWLPPLITILFPVNEKEVIGNYIAKDCTVPECAFYNIHFDKDHRLIMQCVDKNGTVYQTAKVLWRLKNGHSVTVSDQYDRFLFPSFGNIHRNLFFPWVIQIETAIDGECEMGEWNLATKL